MELVDKERSIRLKELERQLDSYYEEIGNLRTNHFAHKLSLDAPQSKLKFESLSRIIELLTSYYFTLVSSEIDKRHLLPEDYKDENSMLIKY